MRWRLSMVLVVLAACSVRAGSPIDPEMGAAAEMGAALEGEHGAGVDIDTPVAEPPPRRPPPLVVAGPEDATPPPAAPVRTTADDPLPRWIDHASLPRDTIENVAIRYGVPALKLRRWNRMSPRGRLHPRHPKDLRVRAKRLPPPRERRVHVAQPGETWDSIARDYGVFDRHLAAWNREALGHRVEPGETVEVWVEPLVYAALRADLRPPGPAGQIAPGAHSIGPPQAGRLVAGVQVPPGPGYERRYPNMTWGTTFAVRHLVEILDRFHASGSYEGTLLLGSMSFRRGGKIGGHVSHQSGRDVDIRLPVRRGVPRSQPARGRNVDWDATLDLVLAFAYSGAVEVIFLDYGAQRRLYRRARRAGYDEALLTSLLQVPEGRGNKEAIVRHSKGHEGHIHVRFACGPNEPWCE